MKKIKLNDKFLLVDGHVAKGGIKHEDKIYYYFCTLKQHGVRILSPLFEDLAKNKDIHLYENPFPKPKNYDLWEKYGDFTQYGKTLTIDCLRWKEAEEKTYINPFIFKL